MTPVVFCLFLNDLIFCRTFLLITIKLKIKNHIHNGGEQEMLPIPEKMVGAIDSVDFRPIVLVLSEGTTAEGEGQVVPR